MAELNAPIGIFDSGVGGLTVVRQLKRLLPAENLIYLGDTARVPYGTKSRDTVIRYAESCARLLLQRKIKLLVLACNTATAHALPSLETQLDLPVIGVVQPGVRAALATTKSNRIGVIATHGTVSSGAYQTGIHAARPDCSVFAQACPLFVPLAEEGWSEGDIPLQIAKHYLAPLLEKDIDTLVLGCTHYPLLKKPIQEIVGDAVKLIDSAEATAASVLDVLVNIKLQNPGNSPANQTYLVSDAPERFVEVGSLFLGETPQQVEWVDF